MDRVAGRYRRFARIGEPAAVVGVLLAVAALAEVLTRPVAGDTSWLAIVLALAMTLPVSLAHLRPVAAALVSVPAMYAFVVIVGVPPAGGVVALGVVCYFLGRHGSARVALVLLLGFAVYAYGPWADDRPGGRALALVLLAVSAGAATTGIVIRSRQEARARDDSLRAMSDTLSAHVARGERARIARDLHDVVAHHISMLALQADAARLTTPGMPDEGARRLVAIADTARTALIEMRRLLGVLREDAGGAPSRRPQPGLWQLTDLLDEARELSGASMRLIVRGNVTPLDAGVELTAYRIVQEALTNVRRHAPGAAVDVELHYRDDALHMRVRDSGPGPPARRARGQRADRHARAGGNGRRAADRRPGHARWLPRRGRAAHPRRPQPCRCRETRCRDKR